MAVPLLFKGDSKCPLPLKMLPTWWNVLTKKLSPLTRYDGFQPYEGIYRLGDWGYVTETEYNKAFEHEDGWAQDAYILDGNGVSHTRISQLINEDDTGKAISDYINERFNNDQMDDVFYTEATEEGEC